MSDELRRLPPDLDALLRAERAADGPNELARGRMRQRLEQTLGVAMTATATTAAPATGKLGATGKLSALGGKSLVAAKLALVLAAGGGLVAAGYFAHRSARSQAAVAGERAHRLSSPAVAVAPAGSAGSTSAPASATAADAAAAARPVTAHIAAAAPRAKVAHMRALPKPGTPVIRTLADERALLEKARTALAGGDGDAALAAVNRHAKLFPSGLLAEERDALRVRAMAARGDDVQAQLDDFQSRYPLSLFLPSVRAAVEGPRPTKPQ
ncbi:MAG TPA: hypothetical protein VIA18_20480 [Polyangia bacterium]|nr:hypothetical protein [Polyangia bacterium]